MKIKEFMLLNNLLDVYKKDIIWLIAKMGIVLLLPYSKICLLFRVGICLWFFQGYLFNYYITKDVYILRGKHKDDDLSAGEKMDRYQAELCFLGMENKELRDKASWCSTVVFLLLVGIKFSYLFGIVGIILSLTISIKVNSMLYTRLKE